MRGLTIWQPWASLIATGDKTIETRGWPMPAGVIGERVAIHAAKREPDPDALDAPIVHHTLASARRRGVLADRPLPLGAVVAIATFVGCDAIDPVTMFDEFTLKERGLGHYAAGRYSWRLDRVEALAEPVECRGKQGLWAVPEDLAARLPA